MIVPVKILGFNVFVFFLVLQQGDSIKYFLDNVKRIGQLVSHSLFSCIL